MKESKIKYIAGVVLILIGIVFIYVGDTYFSLAESYTNLALMFAKQGTHPELVVFDLNMAQSDYARGMVGTSIGVVLAISGVILLIGGKYKRMRR